MCRLRFLDTIRSRAAHGRTLQILFRQQTHICKRRWESNYLRTLFLPRKHHAVIIPLYKCWMYFGNTVNSWNARHYHIFLNLSRGCVIALAMFRNPSKEQKRIQHGIKHAQKANSTEKEDTINWLWYKLYAVLFTVDVNRSEKDINEGLQGAGKFSVSLAYTVFLDSLHKLLWTDFTVLQKFTFLSLSRFFCSQKPQDLIAELVQHR